MDDHVGEGDVAQQLEPRPDHPVLPEADDLARRRVDVAGVVALELGRLLGPAERRVRPERRREPGVEHVGIARELGRAALGARVGRRPGAGDVAVGAVPERLLVAPPELAGDVPVRDLLERADRELVLRLRVVADAPLAQRLERRLARLLHRDPPLQRDERLDPRVAALAGADRVPVVLPLLEPVVLLQPREDRLVGLLLRLPGEVTRVLVHPAVEADHRQRRQVVVAADLEVHRVVAGRDLERAGAELGLDPLVGDHGHDALDVRDDDLLADRIPVALVVGMHGDGDVGEHRGRTDGGDRDVPGAVGERVARVGQRVVLVLVRDLEVGDRRLVERAPVDDPVGAVDPAAIPEVDEEAHHGLDVGVVHREPLALVVERGAEPAELAHDRLPGGVEVLPDALDERLAAELLARRPLLDELLLDHVLGRDARVVVARAARACRSPASGASGSAGPGSIRSARGPCAARRSRSAAARRSRTSRRGACRRRRGRGPRPPTCAASALRRLPACTAAPSPHCRSR